MFTVLGILSIPLGKANAEKEKKSWTSDICYPGDERLAPMEKRMIRSQYRMGLS